MENTIVSDTHGEIVSYLESCFSPEMKQEVINALSFITTYFNAPFKDEIHSLLYTAEDQDSDSVQTTMLYRLEVEFRDGLRRMGLYLDPETPLIHMNQIMASILFVQHVEDPVPFLRVLETWDSDEEKLATLLSQFSTLDEMTIFSHIESVSASLINAIKDQLSTTEAKLAIVEPEKENSDIDKIVTRIKNFFELRGENNIGFQLLTNGLKIGHEAELYLPFVEDVLDSNDVEQTSENLISFFLLTSDGWNKPIEKYRQLSEQLVKTTANIPHIETKMRAIMEEFIQFEKAKNDAQGLSAVQHQTS